MLFSILVANYNNGCFFEECYRSITAQTYRKWEVIVIDDCSSDGSAEKIGALIKGDSRFTLYLNDRNYGCGYTKRRCASLANGELCGFLDPDDALMPDALKIMVESHLKLEKAALIYSDYYLCKNTFKNRTATKNDVIPAGMNYLTGLYKYRIGHFASFKKRLYAGSEGINPVLQRAVDQDLYLKCEEQGDVCHISECLYLYRIHNGGISTFDNNIKAVAWHIYIIMDACKRRNINFEDILPGTLNNIFYEDDKYKLGKYMLNNVLGKAIFRFLKYVKIIK
jgi:glycosyltransferase involved in cell wall biosynthesis